MNPYSSYAAKSYSTTSSQPAPNNDLLLQRIKQLDEENTRLRNDKMSANEEIFSLKAVMATIEAEAKYNAELELNKLQSELGFKVCHDSYCAAT